MPDKVIVDRGACDLCDACNAVCPTNAILVDEYRWRLDDGACIECVKCVAVCPVEALRMGRHA
jgi:ferredoxin